MSFQNAFYSIMIQIYVDIRAGVYTCGCIRARIYVLNDLLLICARDTFTN